MCEIRTQGVDSCSGLWMQVGTCKASTWNEGGRERKWVELSRRRGRGAGAVKEKRAESFIKLKQLKGNMGNL